MAAPSGWLQIAPGIYIPPWLAGSAFGQSNAVIQQAQNNAAAAAAAAAQQAANAAAARQNALQSQYRQRAANARATANAAVTSLRILGQGPNPVARGAQTSRRDEKKRKKRTTASLQIGGTGSAPGTGLNITG